jgi:hypothetical protein
VEDPTDAARASTKRIEELIRTVEQRGARVFLFELPYSEPVEGSRFAATTREIIHAAFPDSTRWLSIEMNRSELRWADGVHLDERSAIIVTQAMERAFARNEVTEVSTSLSSSKTSGIIAVEQGRR